MIEIKVVQTEEQRLLVTEYCRKKGFPEPYSKLLVVAINDIGSVIGVIGIDTVTQLEPLVTDTARIADILFQRAMGIIQATDANRVEALVNEDHINSGIIKALQKRNGFKLIEKLYRFVKIL